MKLWQKVFVGTITVFMLTFNIGIFYLASYSYSIIRERETTYSIREQEVILSSIASRITNAERIYHDTPRSNERLSAIMNPLAVFYKQQGVLLALFDDGRSVFDEINDIDAGLLALENARTVKTMEATIGGKRHSLVASRLSGYPHLTFVYARDISQIDDFRASIGKVSFVVSVIVTGFLGCSIYLLLRCLTKPITRLTATTAEISDGAYEKRVLISSKDELGALADSFNRMVDSVEDKITRLMRASEDRQQFIDDLTHELKTPLTAILGYSEFLQNAKCDEEVRIKAAKNLHGMALRMKNLSDKLLDLVFSRGGSTELRVVDVPLLLDELHRTMSPTLESRNQKLVVSAELSRIVGDETLVLSMLQNLVDNASKASQPGDAITVKAFTEGNPVFEVIDTGCGMEQQEAGRITSPFYRIDKSRSRENGGFGLGLSIVSRIAELHGAKVEIDTEANVGTAVRVNFCNCLTTS